MKTKLHGLLGCIALLCIATFWTATVVSELWLDESAIATVKNAILSGMWLLIPAMAATGGSGFALGKSRTGRLVDVKALRMKVVAANGLLVLLPSAYFLARWASAGQFDSLFYAVQGLELLAGAVNITLLGLNMRDGLRLTGRWVPKRLATLQR